MAKMSEWQRSPLSLAQGEYSVEKKKIFFMLVIFFELSIPSPFLLRYYDVKYRLPEKEDDWVFVVLKPPTHLACIGGSTRWLY